MKLRRIISIGATLLGFFILASSEKSVGHRYDPKASAGSSARAAREPDVG